VSLADYQALVDDLVRDKDQVIVSARRDVAIGNALQRYSQDAPHQLVRDVTSDGSAQLPLPTDWVDGVSALHEIEYPIGAYPPTLLEPDAFGLYATPSGNVIRVAFQPPMGVALRVTFAAPHQLDSSHDTIPAMHQRALACLAAADLCGQLASYYASESAPTINADVADHQGKTDRYRKRASDLLAEYVRIVGVAPSNRTMPASAIAQPGKPVDSLGWPRMFHPTRNWPQSR